MIYDYKKCNVCNKVKAKDMFNTISIRGSDYMHSWCKSCRSDYNSRKVLETKLTTRDDYMECDFCDAIFKVTKEHVCKKR